MFVRAFRAWNEVDDGLVVVETQLVLFIHANIP